MKNSTTVEWRETSDGDIDREDQKGVLISNLQPFSFVHSKLYVVCKRFNSELINFKLNIKWSNKLRFLKFQSKVGDDIATAGKKVEDGWLVRR